MEYKWPQEGAAGAGDVVGPASSTNNAVARFDGTTGKLIQDSAVTVDDSGNVITPADVTAATVTLPGGDVQTQIDAADTAIADHIADTVGAHAASAISNTPSGNLAATTVQGALNELQTDVDTRATSAALTTHIADVANPHVVTKSQVGLGNVDNTSDASKPVSTAQQTALNLKADLISPSFITPALGTPSAAVLTNATGLPIIAGTTGTLSIARGGTGQTTKAAAFDALSPNSVLGDLTVYGSSSNSRLPTSLLGDVAAEAASATVTMTIATPGVVTLTSHGLVTGDKVYLTTTGALPTGLTASTTYYVIWASSSTFNLATSYANAVADTKITTSGTQSGTHTLFYKGLIINPETRRGALMGNTIASGCVGEKITWSTPPGNQAATTTTSDWTNASITLSRGTWLIIANVACDVTSSNASGAATSVRITITDSANGTVQSQDKSLLVQTPNGGGSNASIGGCLSYSFVAPLSASTTYKLRVQKTDFSGTGSANIRNSATTQSEFFAIRFI